MILIDFAQIRELIYASKEIRNERKMKLRYRHSDLYTQDRAQQGNLVVIQSIQKVLLT